MSYSFERLKLRAAGQDVENHFIKQKETASNLVVVFPGGGYTTMGPMLYYTANAAVERGEDVLLVEYGHLFKDPSLSRETREALICEIAENALNTALQERSYDRLVLVGKSMGTRALAHLARTKQKWNVDDKSVRSIWLTPVLNMPGIAEEVGNLGEAQFLVTGTADDPYYQASALEKFSESVETFVVPGADHGLDIPNDVQASIRTMEELVRRIIEFSY
jgi:hypothetical protein